MDLRDYIRDVADFPKPGITFKDITPLLADPAAFRAVTDRFAEEFADRGVTAVMAAEARGFIFGAPLAPRLDAAFVPVRKPGKLPGETVSHKYELEYGVDELHVHADAVGPGDRVLILDDVLATGGTVAACVSLAERAGAEVVACAFLMELDFLKGREKLGGREVFSLIHY